VSFSAVLAVCDGGLRPAALAGFLRARKAGRGSVPTGQPIIPAACEERRFRNFGSRLLLTESDMTAPMDRTQS
jgi:hypothetical protein